MLTESRMAGYRRTRPPGGKPGGPPGYTLQDLGT